MRGARLASTLSGARDQVAGRHCIRFTSQAQGRQLQVSLGVPFRRP